MFIGCCMLCCTAGMLDRDPPTALKRPGGALDCVLLLLLLLGSLCSGVVAANGKHVRAFQEADCQRHDLRLLLRGQHSGPADVPGVPEWI